MKTGRWSMCGAGRLAGLLLAVVFAGCRIEIGDGKGGSSGSEDKKGGSGLSGTIRTDGSSTVFPIIAAAAEEFPKLHSKVSVQVGKSGTGGGFKKFVIGEIDISNASRPITEDEKATAKKNGVEYVELKVAIDGLTVAVHKENDWCKGMTVAALRKLWEKDSSVKKWSDLDASWPDREIKLYGADTASGTFDYFTEEICGKKGNTRTDYSPNSNDDLLVTGVAGDKDALGYFGFAYFEESQNKIRAVAVASGDDVTKGVLPSRETILSGEYKPLSRPLFVYINKKALERAEVAAFAEYLLSSAGQELVTAVKYVPLKDEDLSATKEALKKAMEK